MGRVQGHPKNQTLTLTLCQVMVPIQKLFILGPTGTKKPTEQLALTIAHISTFTATLHHKSKGKRI